MELFTDSPLLAIISVLGGAIGGISAAIAFAIRRRYAAQAEKIRAEAKIMIEGAGRESRKQNDEMSLKLRELELERDNQRAMAGLVEKLLDQMTRSNDGVIRALERVGVVAEVSQGVIAQNNTELEKAASAVAKNTATLTTLKATVDELQQAIVDLPGTLQQQHEMQGNTLSTMLGAVHTIKMAVDRLIRSQTTISPIEKEVNDDRENETKVGPDGGRSDDHVVPVLAGTAGIGAGGGDGTG